MGEVDGSEESHSGGWPMVIAAWLLVGSPLLWGIWTTLQKAAALFE
jgi:hypothetical protein